MNKYQKELIDLLMKIKDPKLMADFLNDLLTSGELEELGVRLQVVKKLNSGMPQRKIAKDLNIGIATVTRGSRELKDKKGGFKKVLDRYY